MSEKCSKSQPYIFRICILRKCSFFFYKSLTNYLNGHVGEFPPKFDFVIRKMIL